MPLSVKRRPSRLAGADAGDREAFGKVDEADLEAYREGLAVGAGTELTD